MLGQKILGLQCTGFVSGDSFSRANDHGRIEGFSPGGPFGQTVSACKRVQRENNASYTRAKRGHNAKNNAKITRNNAGICGPRVESGAAYVLYFRELRPDREWNLENHARAS